MNQKNTYSMKNLFQLLSLFSAVLLLQFCFVNTSLAADNEDLDEEVKMITVANFNDEFNIGKADYHDAEIEITIDLEELALQLGWTPYMFLEYVKTSDGYKTFVTFTEYIQETHAEDFRTSGFETMKIKIEYNDEVLQTKSYSL